MPTETLVLKLKLDVDLETAHTLDGQSRLCCWLYNKLLEKTGVLKEQFIKENNKDAALTLYSKSGLRNLLPDLKEEHPFLKVVYSSCLKNTALRLTSVIQTYQKSKKKKRKFGWPKFQSWKKNWFSLFYDEPNKGYAINDSSLILSLGMGKDRKRRSIVLSLADAHLLKDKKIRNLRITCELGTYYAVFTFQKNLPEKKPIKKVIALDPNHKNLAYGVNTEHEAIEIASPSWLKSYDKRLDALKSKRDRCVRKSKKKDVLDENGKSTGRHYYLPSKRYQKYGHAIEKLLRKRREQTKTFMYTTAHKLFKEHDCVGIGDYTPHGGGITTPMRRAMNNRSLIGRFKEILSWVALKSGKTFFEYDEKGTTRTCHTCYHVMEQGIDPSLRIWQCPKCQTEHIRDENAAIHGLKRLLNKLTEKKEGVDPSIVSGSDLVYVNKRWAWCVLPSGVKVALRGQNCEEIYSTKKLNREHDSSRSKIDQLCCV